MAALAELLLGTGIVYVFSELNKSKKRQQFDVLRLRSPEGLNDATLDLIDFITIQKDVFPVGSFKYKAHKYPGDIDIFEKVKVCCTFEAAVTKIELGLKNIAKRIKARKDIFLGDFKAGVDDRYKIDVGEYKKGKLVDYNAPRIRRDLTNLKNEGLLNTSEYNELNKLVTNNISKANHEKLREMLRQKYTIRWTVDEMIKGQKKLVRGKVVQLRDAITHKGLVKIDIWAKLNGNYNEITNFFLFVKIDKDNEEIVLNQELEDRIISLNKDIEKYSDPAHRNSLKLAKRLWNKAIFLADEKMHKKLFPLFSSGAAQLNQVVGESEVLRLMLGKLDRKDVPINVMIRQITGFKRRINDVFDIVFNEDMFYELIDDMVDHYENNKGNYDKEVIINGLEKLEEELKKIIEHYSHMYLSQHKVM